MNLHTIKTIALCVPLVLGGCGGSERNDDDCDSPPREYLVTQYHVQALEYNSELRHGMPDINNKPVAANSQVDWKKMAILIKADAQTYNVQIPRISLFPMANACSPQLASASQTIAGISITSSSDFNNQYPAGSELAGLFTALDQPFESIIDIVNIQYPAPLELRLFLREAPTAGPKNFQVTLKLSDGREFQMTTGEIYLK